MYDGNGNPIGISERPTTDSTGEKGFAATLADLPVRSYGLVFDTLNQLSFAQMYVDGQLTGEWSLTRDVTGNFRSIVDRKSDNVFAVMARDSVHRPIEFSGLGFTANPYYDVRGRLIGFNYYEEASPQNGNTKRALKVNYTYAANGVLIARTGTVSTNLGPDTIVSGDEIDKWLGNVESGIIPAAPLSGMVAAMGNLRLAQELGLEPVCPECAILAGARFAWLVFQISRDPAWASKNGIPQAIEAKQCKPTTGNSASDIVFKRDHYINRAQRDGLNLDHAEAQVADEISAIRTDMLPGTNTIKQITVDGRPVEFRAFVRGDGQVNVGTIFVVK
ncbi:hypothetical protein [Paraburkholderia metrosideri]|nr:hypothetical protein [Paraburkholderia metrosideri]